MWWNLVCGVVSAVIVVGVAELSKRHPRLGALLLTLPVVSILAILLSWTQHRDLAAISELSREALLLVPLCLPFFLPLAFVTRTGQSYWTAFGAGVGLASVTIGRWLWLAPREIQSQRKQHRHFVSRFSGAARTACSLHSNQ